MVKDRPEISQADVTFEENGRYKIVWKASLGREPIHVFYGLKPETIDRTAPLAVVSNRNEAMVSGLDPDKRYYFEISPAGRPGIIVALRRVVLEGSHNFRDMGGYRARDGRRVKWGKLFRSDALSRLSEPDLRVLEQIGLKSVIDFRSREETEKAPDILPENKGITYRHYPIQTGEMNFVTAMERLKEGDYTWLTDDYMIRGYLKNIDRYPLVWGNVIDYLAGDDVLPLDFHCTGGKDRAGTFAALVLALLGVPDETIIMDHQLTNHYTRSILPKITARLIKHGIDPIKVKPYFEAPRDGIPVILERIYSRYGSVENYLITKGGVAEAGLDRIREKLLES